MIRQATDSNRLRNVVVLTRSGCIWTVVSCLELALEMKIDCTKTSRKKPGDVATFYYRKNITFLNNSLYCRFSKFLLQTVWTQTIFEHDFKHSYFIIYYLRFIWLQRRKISSPHSPLRVHDNQILYRFLSSENVYGGTRGRPN